MSQAHHNILVVDDSITVRKQLELMLVREGFWVDCAENGIKALEILAKSIPHAILVDFLMPGMNGHVFCKKVREMEALADVPIVLISSRAESVACYFEGTVGKIHILEKPLALSDLLNLLDEILPELPEEEEQLAESQSVLDEDFEEPSVLDGSFEDQSAPSGGLEEHPAPKEALGDAEQAAELEESDSTLPTPKVSSSGVDLDELTERIDRVVAQYFRGSFPHLLKQVMHDTLRQTGLIDSDQMILSGTIETVGLPDALNFIANSRLTGRLSVLSRWCLGEIFVDNGKFVFASISRKGSHEFLTDLIFDKSRSEMDRKKIMAVIEGARLKQTRVGRELVARGLITEEKLADALRRHSQNAVNSLLEVEYGRFFLENQPLPTFLEDISERPSLMQVLMDGLRVLDETRREFRDEAAVYMRLIDNKDAIDDLGLKHNEIELLSHIDGERNLSRLADASNIELPEAARICYALTRVGLARLISNSAA